MTLGRFPVEFGPKIKFIYLFIAVKNFGTLPMSVAVLHLLTWARHHSTMSREKMFHLMRPRVTLNMFGRNC